MRATPIFRLYDGRDWVIILATALLAWWSYSQAKGTVRVADPPKRTNLAIVAHVEQPNATHADPEIPYKAAVTVNLLHGCRNPVSVAVGLYLGGSLKTTGPSASPFFKPITADVAVSDSGVGAVHARGGSGIWQRPLAVQVRKATPPGSARLVTTTARRLPDQAPELHLTFAANWVRNRTTRSCFVLLPDLSGADAQRATNLVHAQDPARTGLVAIGFRSGTIEPYASIPPPTNLREQSWTCAYDPRTLHWTPCSGVAVFDEPNATGAAAARIFFYGAILGVLLTILIETLRRIRLPPPPA